MFANWVFTLLPTQKLPDDKCEGDQTPYLSISKFTHDIADIFI